MLELKDPVFFNFWRPSRYCSSSNHYVLRDSQHLEGLRYAEHLCEKVNFGLFPKDLHQVGTMISSVHASQWNIATLRAVALLKAVLWRDACRENTLEVVEIGATRSVASVPAVYQFLSVEQKSKVIFVPHALYSKLSHIKCDLKFFPSLQRHSIMKRREWFHANN